MKTPLIKMSLMLTLIFNAVHIMAMQNKVTPMTTAHYPQPASNQITPINTMETNAAQNTPSTTCGKACFNGVVRCGCVSLAPCRLALCCAGFAVAVPCDILHVFACQPQDGKDCCPFTKGVKKTCDLCSEQHAAIYKNPTKLIPNYMQ